MSRYSIIFLCVILSACGSSPKTSFYMLGADSHSTGGYESAAKGAAAVGVWRVNLPDFLDRNELVVRDNQFEIKVADFSIWIGNLEDNMTQLVVDELALQLQSNKIIKSPWRAYRKNDYQVQINIDRFDGMLGGEVVLKGAWSLLDANGDKELSRELFIYKVTAADKSYKQMVAALSQLTVELAGDISKAIKLQRKN